jgi:flagellar biosynthesis component FlhA
MPDAPTARERRAYLVNELDRVLRQHIASFLGVQDVQNMLDVWVQGVATDAAEALRARAVPDIVAHVRLTRVLGCLLREGIRLVNIEAILTAFIDASALGGGDREVVDRMRALLRQELPGNTPGRALLGLAPEFEAAVDSFIQPRNGSRVLDMPNSARRELLEAIRVQLGTRSPEQFVLVVSRADLRPHVRELLESEMGNLWLPVLAASELSDWTLPGETVHFAQRQPDLVV